MARYASVDLGLNDAVVLFSLVQSTHREVPVSPPPSPLSRLRQRATSSDAVSLKRTTLNVLFDFYMIRGQHIFMR